MLDETLRYDVVKSMEPIIGGPVQISDEAIILKTPNGENFELRRFDHVLIRIRVVQSRYLFNQYSFFLLGKSVVAAATQMTPLPNSIFESGRCKQGKIIAQLKPEDSLERAYGQSKAKKSMYEMFQRFTELSLIVGSDD